MIRNISIGIDMGSTTTRVVVGEFLKGEKNPKIIGIGKAKQKVSDMDMSLTYLLR